MTDYRFVFFLYLSGEHPIVCLKYREKCDESKNPQSCAIFATESFVFNSEKAMLEATEFSPANRGYFRGGGFSSTYSTQSEMPVTLVRVNMVDGIGYTMQIAEGWTAVLPDRVNRKLWERTDRTWPSTWFVPRLNNTDAFSSVYNVMANWGANHGAFVRAYRERPDNACEYVQNTRKFTQYRG